MVEVKGSEEKTSEEVPLQTRVTMARKSNQSSRAPFRRVSHVIPPLPSAAPSEVLKRMSQPPEGAAPKRARVLARQGTESPDV